jgi:cytochrome P450
MTGAQSAIPRLPGLPIAGNIFEYARSPTRLLLRVHRELGDTGYFRMGVFPVLSVAKPSHIETILVDRADAFEKGLAYRFLKAILGNGLVTASNAVQRRQRKLVAPALAHRRVVGYAGAMVQLAETTQARWAEGGVIDVHEEMMRLTQLVVAETLFHADVLPESAELSHALTVANEWVGHEIAQLIPIPKAVPTPRNLRLWKAIRRLDSTVYRLIAERRASGDQGDILSMLLLAKEEGGGEGMSDRQVRDEALTIFVAGHETTANALTWTFYLLSRHPEVAGKVRAEVVQALGGGLPTYQDLGRMPYTLQVLKESMRLYPPVYAVSRRAVEDVPVDDFVIRRGTILFINIYAMHRNPQLYPDPERFDPERFTPENERRRPRGAYLPFGAGPRNCIGSAFAMMEGHLLLATLSQRVKFELVPGQTIVEEPLVTLRPKTAIRMVVRRTGGDVQAASGVTADSSTGSPRAT